MQRPIKQWRQWSMTWISIRACQKCWTNRVPFLLSLPAPNVALNVTAKAESNSTIMVTWKIENIHDQLIAGNFIIQYCEVEGNNQDKLLTRCNRRPCKYNNVTTSPGTGAHTEHLTGLPSYTRYRIKVKAINITARDGTEVATPYGEYSNSSYDNTSEAGEEFVFS